MSARKAWLSTPTSLDPFQSVAAALAAGVHGETIHADDDGRPASKPSYRIVQTTRRKFASKIRYAP